MTVTKSYPLERDEIRIPTAEGYRVFPLLLLLGANHSKLSGRTGLGLGPVRFIESSSPYQHGVSVQGMRWQSKTIQIVIQSSQADLAKYWNERSDLLELLRPTRAFLTKDKLIDPFFYRKWLPGGTTIRGGDMVVTSGSDSVFSASGSFIHTGGLDFGNAIFINDVKYVIASVPNDFELRLTTAYAAGTDTSADYHYYQVPHYREIPFIPEAGPTFDEGVNNRMAPFGYQEVLRFRCHDPFWRGANQERIFTLPTTIGDLVFDGEGAYFGIAGLTGRFVFQPDYVSDTVSLVYHGHDVARPIISISGPAEFPTVTNLTTAISLNLDYDVAAGEQVTMDIDRLSVTNNFGDNLLGFLRGNFAGFGLVPEPAASRGINLLNVTFGAATAASSVRIAWQNVYAGI